MLASLGNLASGITKKNCRGWHIKTSHSLTGPLNSVLYDPPDVSHPRVDVF